MAILNLINTFLITSRFYEHCLKQYWGGNASQVMLVK